MFFVMSGYLFYVNYEPSKLVAKLRSRIFSILIPYLIWNEIGFLYYHVISLVPMVRNSLNASLEPLTLQSIVSEAIFGGHNITWFLQDLMLFTVVTPLLYRLLRHKMSVVLLAIVYAPGPWNSHVYYWFYYLVGVYIAIHLKDRVQNKTFTHGQMAVAGAILAICAAINICFQSSRPLRILILISIVCMWIVMDIARNEKDPVWWARLSFYIYLSHRMILESVEKVFLIVFGVSNWAAVLDFVVAPILTMIILLIGACILQRMPRMWHVLNGGR